MDRAKRTGWRVLAALALLVLLEPLALAAGPGETVGVSSFRAVRYPTGVYITWRTASERMIAGFRLWAGAQELTRQIIPAQAAGQAQARQYDFWAARRWVGSPFRLGVVTRLGVIVVCGPVSAGRGR